MYVPDSKVNLGATCIQSGHTTDWASAPVVTREDVAKLLLVHVNKSLLMKKLLFKTNFGHENIRRTQIFKIYTLQHILG